MRPDPDNDRESPAAPTGSPGPATRLPDSGAASHGAEEDEVVSVDTVVISSSDVAPEHRFRERGLLIEMVKDEVIRAAVAILLLGLLTAVILLAFKRAKTWDQTKELLDLVLPAVSALLGSAVGFYFGSKAG